MNKIPYDLTLRENMILYFSLKNKHGYSLENRDEVLGTIACEIDVSNYDCIIIPESTSDFLEQICIRLKKKYIVLEKNDIEYFKELAKTLGLQRAELKSHIDRMDEMGDNFRINLLKAQQRKRYIPYLFKTISAPPNSVLLDDSNFTGCTREAMRYSTGVYNYIPIFSKDDENI